ncbi:MAG: class 1 fructose-bisphosphatase [Chlorobi bacterium]|nr:MAG: class 1 fructose-bisphosphatase [Bacteroidota bacterium]KXK34518.1 MAG: Fructose-1,6-bisphosphatase [Chlorobi bacterium OLB6]MBE2264813.1 class 1 fructose-bisphosphatase [Flavobacteriales bacterium]MBL1160814.1 class 1 fructose-bisphosphatase [Chlorobiota bacterium]MBW7852778.1 class 1 fructose-bisphosphatase [Candidatus Kapabacteria bacterium]MCC6330983.1 class 1 fructose-bisphosphatase [Ignavibacteria bacterium]
MPLVKTSRLVTIERHIVEQGALHPSATGEFSRLLRDLTLAIRILAHDVRRSGLNDILGLTESTNVHGERVKRLDIHANDVIFRAMDHGGHLCVMASEEESGLIQIPDEYAKGKYVLVFDPLDGSSNIDVNVSIGTIFSIYRRLNQSDTSPGTEADVMQPGYKQVAAGYAMYGSSTQLVYTTGSGVDVFTYEPTIGEFLLTFEKLQIPKRGSIYSVNSGNSHKWSEGVRSYVRHLLEPSDDGQRPYSLRYVGTMVADIHRTLHYGGIFMYPADKTSPLGKLRLVYEVNPMSFIVEQAGGRATTGFERILDIIPSSLHQRIPCFMGSEEDVKELEQFLTQL